MLESVQALFDEPIIAVIAGSFCRECRGYHEAQKEHAALPKVRERQPHASQQLKLDNIARREATISQWLASACKIAAARGHGTIATQKKGLVDMLDISVKLAAEFTVLAPLYTPLRKNYQSLIQKFHKKLSPGAALHSATSQTFIVDCSNTDALSWVKVGVCAVSRYHQVRKFFLVGDEPNLPDHDFPFPGYLLDTQGLMLMADKDSAASQELGFMLRRMEQEQDKQFELACHEKVKGKLTARVAHSMQGELSGKSKEEFAAAIQAHVLQHPEVIKPVAPAAVEEEPMQGDFAVDHEDVPLPHPSGAGPLQADTYRDKYGRLRIAAPQNGPIQLVSRACKFHQVTNANHAEQQI